jgi:hypothetical protein
MSLSRELQPQPIVCDPAADSREQTRAECDGIVLHHQMDILHVSVRQGWIAPTTAPMAAPMT